MVEPWLERWAEGRIGWHEVNGNASLKKYWRAARRRVLVPLCGKTKDLIWLAGQGNEVVGVELSELAVTAFFEENELAYSMAAGELPAYRATDLPITIYCGDYFVFTGGPYDAHFDRGALVALPADLRPAYVDKTKSLLEPDAEKLLITLEYDQETVAGPPFSVAADEVQRYWPNLVRVDAYNDIDNAPPKFREAGLKQLTETVWRSG